MVDVVQLVEHRIVVPSVVGSSPIIHPPQAAGTFARGFFVFRRLPKSPALNSLYQNTL